MPKSTPAGRPGKPYDGFPLFPHASGRWAKKIPGKLHYFGKWHDADAALERFQQQRDDLYAGRKPRTGGDGLTVADAVNQFLGAKRSAVDAGELTLRAWSDYLREGKSIVDVFGRNRHVTDLRPDDFDLLRRRLASGVGPVTLGNRLQRVRSVFRFCHENGLVDRPIVFGQAFRRPSRKTVRLDRAKKGPNMLESDEVRQLIAQASVPLQAMLLLGVNAALGNADIAALEFRHLNMSAGWLSFPRTKTGIDRRAKLWPETMRALQAAIDARPAPRSKSYDSLVFVTRLGNPWCRVVEREVDDGTAIVADNAVSKATTKLLKELNLHRAGIGFYTLRHVFRTVADSTNDRPAIDYVMGHADHSMAAAYRERVDDSRLEAIAEHVRAWLWPTAKKRVGTKPAISLRKPRKQ